MKSYTVESPAFSDSIQITETTDMAHADNINAGPKQLLENTLANKESIDKIEEIINEPNGYDEETTYSVGECCSYGSKIYTCIAPTSGAWDESCWEELSLTSLAEEVKNIETSQLSVSYEGEDEALIVRAGA